MSHLCLFVTLVIIVTSDYLALRQNILENPEGDLPRLVLADYLEETGVRSNILSAHFIRDHIQVWHDEGQASNKKTLVKMFDAWYFNYYNNYERLSDGAETIRSRYRGQAKLLNYYYQQAVNKETSNLSKYNSKCSVVRVTKGFVSSVDVVIETEGIYGGGVADKIQIDNVALKLSTHPMEEIRIRTRSGTWEKLLLERWGEAEWRFVYRQLNQVKSRSVAAKRGEVFNELYRYIKHLGWVY